MCVLRSVGWLWVWVCESYGYDPSCDEVAARGVVVGVARASRLPASASARRRERRSHAWRSPPHTHNPHTASSRLQPPRHYRRPPHHHPAPLGTALQIAPGCVQSDAALSTSPLPFRTRRKLQARLRPPTARSTSRWQGAATAPSAWRGASAWARRSARASVSEACVHGVVIARARAPRPSS